MAVVDGSSTTASMRSEQRSKGWGKGGGPLSAPRPPSAGSDHPSPTLTPTTTTPSSSSASTPARRRHRQTYRAKPSVQINFVHAAPSDMNAVAGTPTNAEPNNRVEKKIYRAKKGTRLICARTQPNGGATTSNTQDDAEKLDELKRAIFYNDLIMTEIVSHVINMNDRSRLELACPRLYELSKYAPYRFPSGGDHLSITFTTLDDFATVKLGSFTRIVPILTLETRRFDGMRSELTPQLRRILSGMGDRFARSVRRLTLGGTSEYYAARAVPNHHIIVTPDLLECLLRVFPALTTVHFVRCGFDDRAVDFCETEQWKEAAARLTEVRLASVWCDTAWRIPSIVSPLGKNLRHLELARFTCKRLGAAIVKMLKDGEVHLERIAIEVDDGTAATVDELHSFAKAVASRSDTVELTVVEAGDGAVPCTTCFQLLDRLPEIPQLSSLHVRVQAKRQDQFETLQRLFKNLLLLPRLRSLHIEGYREDPRFSPWMLGCMAAAVREGLEYCRDTLEELSLNSFPSPFCRNNVTKAKEEAQLDLAWAIAESMPRKLRVLRLQRMRLDDEIVREMFRNSRDTLEELYLNDVRYLDSNCVQALLNGVYPELRRLEVEIPVYSNVLRRLGETLPHLQYAKFALRHRISYDEPIFKLLEKLFGNVYTHVELPRGPCKQFLEVHHRHELSSEGKRAALDAYDTAGRERVARPHDDRDGDDVRRRPPQRKQKKLLLKWEDV